MTDRGAAQAEEADEADRDQHPGRLLRETVVLLVVAIALAVVVKTFFVQAFYIPSGSMEPGLQIDDRILVEKPSYWFSGTPQRGDIVVFDDPGGWLNELDKPPEASGVAKALSKIGLYPTGGHLVKRVVGVAGDTIECCDVDGRLRINGEPVDEDDFLIEQRACDGPMIRSCKWKAGPVPAGRIFVMGDNRENSADSSYHLCRPPGQPGCDPDDAYVPVDSVVGKVFALVWPVKRFDWLGRPDAFEDVPSPR